MPSYARKKKTRHLACRSNQEARYDSIVGKPAAFRIPVALVLAQLFNVLFFFIDTATTKIYTLSLHDALPIFDEDRLTGHGRRCIAREIDGYAGEVFRSEEHTSELQSRENLVCRLLLEKK